MLGREQIYHAWEGTDISWEGTDISCLGGIFVQPIKTDINEITAILLKKTFNTNP